MVKEVRRGTKSEVLSLRMDATTRFLVDFLARYRGQSITTVVDRAIAEAADRIELDYIDSRSPKNWRDYWHINDGVRSLKIWSDTRLYPSFEEQYIVAFAKTHWPFFYVNNAQDAAYNEAFIDIIWPKIHEFIEIWRATKSTDYFAAGRAMQESIRAAGVKAPDWPPKPVERPTAPKAPKPRLSDQLDDDIPF